MHDLNECLALVRVVELGSFTAAARALQVPKSTLSRKLAELELRLGAQLLHRTTRKLGLTEAGAVYYQHCRRIVAELDAAERAVSCLQEAPRGWLRVAAAPSVATSWLAPLLGAFHARHPQVQVEILLGDEHDLIAEQIDVALRTGPQPDSMLIARRLSCFRTHVYASPDYLARYGEPLHPEQLISHRALCLSSYRHNGRFLWPLHRGGGGSEGPFPVRPLLVCSDAGLLHGPLAAGEGLALACAFSMRPLLESAAVRPILVDWSGPELDFNAVFPRGQVMSTKVRVFIDFLVERLGPAPLAQARAA